MQQLMGVKIALDCEPQNLIAAKQIQGFLQPAVKGVKGGDLVLHELFNGIAGALGGAPKDFAGSLKGISQPGVLGSFGACYPAGPRRRARHHL